MGTLSRGMQEHQYMECSTHQEANILKPRHGWYKQTKPECHVGKAAVTWGTHGVTWGTRGMTGSFSVTGGTFSAETEACTGAEAPWVLHLQGRRLQASETRVWGSAGDSRQQQQQQQQPRPCGQARILEVLLWRRPPGGSPNRRLEFVRWKPGDGELRAQSTEVLKGTGCHPGQSPVFGCWTQRPPWTPTHSFSGLNSASLHLRDIPFNPPSWLRENPALPMTFLPCSTANDQVSPAPWSSSLVLRLQGPPHPHPVYSAACLGVSLTCQR